MGSLRTRSSCPFIEIGRRARRYPRLCGDLRSAESAVQGGRRDDFISGSGFSRPASGTPAVQGFLRWRAPRVHQVSHCPFAVWQSSPSQDLFGWRYSFSSQENRRNSPARGMAWISSVCSCGQASVPSPPSLAFSVQRHAASARSATPGDQERWALFL